jgi:hypothetical protein
MPKLAIEPGQQSLDQLIGTLEAIRAQKAELEKQEQAVEGAAQQQTGGAEQATEEIMRGGSSPTANGPHPVLG